MEPKYIGPEHDLTLTRAALRDMGWTDCGNGAIDPDETCDDGDLCTGGDVCTAGVCGGTQLCTPKHAKVLGLHTNNQLGPLQLDHQGERALRALHRHVRELPVT